MAGCDEGLCCLPTTMYMSSSPQNRADCGPVIWTSGLIEANEDLAEFASGKAKAFESEFLKPLPFDEPSFPVKCIDPETGLNQNNIAPANCDCTSLCSSSFRGVKNLIGHCWNDSDISQYCRQYTLSPEEYILGHATNEYWIRFWEKQALSIAKGIMLDNMANDDGDMVVDGITEPSPSADGTGTTTKFNINAHTRALGNFGACGTGSYQGIIMHKDVFFNNLLMSENACCMQTAYPSELILNSPLLKGRGLTSYTYQGTPVYVSDSPQLVDKTTPTAPIYTSIYFGQGAIQFGEGDLTRLRIRAVEMDRDPCTNGKMGTTRWFVRKTWAIHPFGFTNKFDADGSADHFGMSSVEASNPENWDRVTDRGNVGLTFVLTSG